jgi:hypothetical protein
VAHAAAGRPVCGGHGGIALAGAPSAAKKPPAARHGLARGAASVPAQVLGTLAIGPQQRVVTVQLGEGEQAVRLVLGVTAQQINACMCCKTRPHPCNPPVQPIHLPSHRSPTR